MSEKTRANAPSSSIATVLQQMSGKTVTLGWDVVVGYNADSVNDLFAQQYVANVRANQNLPPITDSISLGTGVQVLLANVVLGPPLISFTPQVGNQQAIVDMNFIAGEVMVLEQSGSVQYVSGYQAIVPGDQYTLQMIVDLQQVTGEVTNSKAVIVDLQNASNYKANLLSGTSAAVYLGQYFQEFFEKVTQGNLTYQLGALTFGTSENLTPVSFDIRTQPAPDSTSDGAVLLFVATTFNPTGGNLPGSEFPYLIPQGYGCYVVVASKTLFANIMAPYYQYNLNGNPTLQVNQGAGSDPSSYLTFIGGGIDCGVITASWSSGGGVFHSVWSGSPGDWMNGNPGYKNVVVPFNGLSIQPSNDLLAINWSNTWSQQWTGTTAYSGGESGSANNIDLSISGSFNANPSVASNDVVSFSGYGSPSITFQESSWLSKWFGNGDLRDQAGSAMVGKAAPVAKQILNFQIPQVNAFAVSHLLFPAENALQFSEAYVPGDLALFGAIQPSETAFTVSPLQSVIAGGETQQFSVSGGETVAWTINPRIGSISQSGLYTAPLSVPQAIPIVVTATSGDDVSTAILTVVPSPIAVSPAFTVVFPNAQPTTFVAAVLGNLGAVTWSISPSDGSCGTISSSGVYTPPSPLPAGVNVATITATAGNQSATALLALVNAVMAFGLTPAYATLGPDGTQQFNAGGGVTLNWSVLPSGAGSITSDGLYTAPSSISKNSTALVLVQMPSDMSLVGIGVVILTPQSTQ